MKIRITNFWIAINVSCVTVHENYFSENFIILPICMVASTDQETDESWDISIVWKINSGLVWVLGYCEKKSLGPIMSIFWGPRRSLCFHVQKINLMFYWKYCSVRTEKLNIIKVKKVKKNWEVFFMGEKLGFFRAKNFNVSTKTIWSVLCWLLLW